MTKPLPDTIKVRITKADIRKAGEYYDCKRCLLGTALRRLGFRGYKVTGMEVFFGKAMYEIDDLGLIAGAYGSIEIKPTSKPFTVTLKKVDA